MFNVHQSRLFVPKKSVENFAILAQYTPKSCHDIKLYKYPCKLYSFNELKKLVTLRLIQTL